MKRASESKAGPNHSFWFSQTKWSLSVEWLVILSLETNLYMQWNTFGCTATQKIVVFTCDGTYVRGEDTIPREQMDTMA